jgi:hypothetical protein
MSSRFNFVTGSLIIAIGLIGFSMSGKSEHNISHFAKRTHAVHASIIDPTNLKIDEEYIGVFNKLTSGDAYFNKVKVHLILDKKNGEINAFTQSCGKDCANVTVTKGMIDFLSQKPDRINFEADVMGHELGHARHGDVFNGLRAIHCNSNNTGSRDCEKDADMYGQGLATKVGYNGCTMAALMTLYRDAVGEIPDGEDHPTFSDRITYLTCPDRK